MKKFILIAAAMTLVSASAHAGPSRSLTLASNETPAPVAQPVKAVEPLKTVEPLKSAEPAKPAETSAVPCATTTTDAKPAEAPKFVERPAPIEPAATPDQPNLDPKPVASQTPKAGKAKRRSSGWSEARIIGELHRHGIYW
jgi:outer membrane biosynthesis protein TonB